MNNFLQSSHSVGNHDIGKKRKLSSAFRSSSLPLPMKSAIETVTGTRLTGNVGDENVPNHNYIKDSRVTEFIVEEDILYEICFICDLRLDTLTEKDKEEHLHNCLDQCGIEANEDTKVNATEHSERGLRLKEYFCVICDINLSRKKLLDRCLHLKKCAKDHQMTTKQLLQFISPADPDRCDGDEEGLSDENQPLASDGVVNLLSDDEEKSKPATASKNAWSVLMASSKQQNSLLKAGAGFEKKPKIPKTVIKASSSTSTRTTKKSATTITNSSPVEDTVVGSNGLKPTSFKRQPKKAWGNATKQNKGGPQYGDGNYAPAYKKVQYGDMTYPIIVDGFQYASSLLSDCYFLTHFHSDHYTGLTKEFICGSIYCSPTTANLVKLKLKVHSQHIIALDLETKYTITVSGVDVEVMFTDANHCPGAVCIHFKFPNGRIVFHTGDFRWNDQLLRKSSLLRSLSATSQSSNMRNLVVYLDTTYCDPNYDFPRQDLVINAVVDCVREENKSPGALFVFGAYAIGKERVFMAVAQELNSRVYVDGTRWKSMCCYDWSMEEKARLTTDPSVAQIWVVGMHQINFNHLETIRRKKPTCNRIIAFQPTGWTYSSKHPSATAGTLNVPAQDPIAQLITKQYPFIHIRKKEGNTIYALPYSEHSSFGELIEFVRTFRPCRIIPTVNTTTDKVEQQIKLLKEKSGVYDVATNNNLHPYPPIAEISNSINRTKSNGESVREIGLARSHTFPSRAILGGNETSSVLSSTSTASLDYLFSTIETENSIFL